MEDNNVKDKTDYEVTTYGRLEEQSPALIIYPTIHFEQGTWVPDKSFTFPEPVVIGDKRLMPPSPI